MKKTLTAFFHSFCFDAFLSNCEKQCSVYEKQSTVNHETAQYNSGNFLPAAYRQCR